MRTRRRGMSVLEVLVAVAIMAVALVPLLAIQSFSIRSSLRHEEVYTRTQLERNALVMLRDVNPMEVATGERPLQSDATLSWTSEMLTPETLSVGYPIGDGEFLVSLHKVRAVIRQADRTILSQFEIERVGWRSMRTISGAPSD